MTGVILLVVLTSLLGGRGTGSVCRDNGAGLRTAAVQRVQNVSERLNMTSLWGEEYDY